MNDCPRQNPAYRPTPPTKGPAVTTAGPFLYLFFLPALNSVGEPGDILRWPHPYTRQPADGVHPHNAPRAKPLLAKSRCSPMHLLTGLLAAAPMGQTPTRAGRIEGL